MKIFRTVAMMSLVVFCQGVSALTLEWPNWAELWVNEGETKVVVDPATGKERRERQYSKVAMDAVWFDEDQQLKLSTRPDTKSGVKPDPKKRKSKDIVIANKKVGELLYKLAEWGVVDKVYATKKDGVYTVTSVDTTVGVHIKDLLDKIHGDEIDLFLAQQLVSPVEAKKLTKSVGPLRLTVAMSEVRDAIARDRAAKSGKAVGEGGDPASNEDPHALQKSQ